MPNTILQKIRCAGLLTMIVLAPLTITTGKAFAQASSSSDAAGSVTDSSGAVVPGAKVTIENSATQVKRELVTNSAGEYDAIGLDPGVYSVTVTAPSFQTQVRDHQRIEVGLALRADFQLTPGSVTQDQADAIREAAKGSGGDLVALRKRLSFPMALAEIRLALI